VLTCSSRRGAAGDFAAVGDFGDDSAAALRDACSGAAFAAGDFVLPAEVGTFCVPADVAAFCEPADVGALRVPGEVGALRVPEDVAAFAAPEDAAAFRAPEDAAAFCAPADVLRAEAAAGALRVPADVGAFCVPEEVGAFRAPDSVGAFFVAFAPPTVFFSAIVSPWRLMSWRPASQSLGASPAGALNRPTLHRENRRVQLVDPPLQGDGRRVVAPSPRL
jgi:hypothetical protein